MACPDQYRSPELAELYQFKTGSGKLVQPASEENLQRAKQLFSDCLKSDLDQPTAEELKHPLYSWPVVNMVRLTTSGREQTYVTSSAVWQALAESSLS